MGLIRSRRLVTAAVLESAEGAGYELDKFVIRRHLMSLKVGQPPSRLHDRRRAQARQSRCRRQPR